jgi:hypothetical protein
MKLIFKTMVFVLLVLFAVSCASTGRKPYEQNLDYKSSKRVPAWVTDMRKIRKAQKDRIYFYGIGENTREKIANEEAGRDAALQFSRYVMNYITSDQTEKYKSENAISNIVSEKTEQQITQNYSTQQILIERYIERRTKSEYDKPVEYFKIYALYSFPKLQSINMLKDVSAFLKANKSSDKEENAEYTKAAERIDALIKEVERNEAFIVNVQR